MTLCVENNMLIGDTVLISPSLMCFTYILLIGEWNTSQLGQKLAFRQFLKMTEHKQVFPCILFEGPGRMKQSCYDCKIQNQIIVYFHGEIPFVLPAKRL